MSAALYQPFFCEENITKLCERTEFAGHEMWAVFITNAARTCVCQQQRASSENEPTLWDYHVVALSTAFPGQETSATSGEEVAKPPHGHTEVWAPFVIPAAPSGDWLCWDFDTRLPFPCLASDYISKTFEGLERFHRSTWPRFRVVERRRLSELFSSDRMHMQVEGAWLQPPPPWRPILNGPPTLSRFLDVDDEFGGPWLSLDELFAFIGGR
ncbi:MAG: hypothetical protein CO108_01995 [Deltaproteobacteria bacterium CG_4_9_14_3_um_filter_63_12]|nr:MAG: hypothetical protein COW42_05080 [Deltaproteobacteria bacterium CG17_big_fil_post_rev_8_21_14_2_50_63_7]PJB48659.1 MAG: hypothetical protein CO108_01995 [Deltaproteobacteria bacterium CG_4_9_14_3_um_filter_63_12]